MSGAWISAYAALTHAVSVEVSPEIAERKLIQAIATGALPAKVRSGKSEKFFSRDMFLGKGASIKVDFQTGEGRYVWPSYALGGAPYEDWTFKDLAVSERHMDSMWPREEFPQKKTGRPKGTGLAGADAPLIEKMHKLIQAGKATSPTKAAWEVMGRDGSGASGAGAPESKAKRLVDAYKAAHGV
jgi:hypothetical protein